MCRSVTVQGRYGSLIFILYVYARQGTPCINVSNETLCVTCGDHIYLLNQDKGSIVQTSVSFGRFNQEVCKHSTIGRVGH